MSNSTSAASQSVNILQIGYGYWGPNVTRNIASVPGVRIAALVDTQQDAREKFSKQYPDAETGADYTAFLRCSDINGVIISTPAATHYRIAKEVLEAGKHVLVEKPIALSSSDGAELVALAERNRCILMVGHTFLYNPAVRRLKHYIDSGELGDIYYIYSHRLNLGIIRQDINALWNFAPHDVSIIVYLLPDKKPLNVTARGFSYIQKNIEDVVFFTVEFAGGISANVHISWIDPNKVRRLTVVGSKKMAVYDDVSNDAKLQLFDKGVDIKYTNSSEKRFDNYGEFQLLVRAGDMVVPRIDFVEPLKVECAHFIECVRTGMHPLTDGVHGLAVVKILEAAERSMKNGGYATEIEQ